MILQVDTDHSQVMGFCWLLKLVGKIKALSKAFVCGDFGHFAYDCPSKGSEDEKLNATIDAQREKGPPTNVDVSPSADGNAQDDKKSNVDNVSDYYCNGIKLFQSQLTEW